MFGDLVPPVGHCKGLYLGSGNRQHWCSSQEDPDILGSSRYKYSVLYLSSKSFPKNVSDLVKTDLFSFMCPDLNVWKKFPAFSTIHCNKDTSEKISQF